MASIFSVYTNSIWTMTEILPKKKKTGWGDCVMVGGNHGLRCGGMVGVLMGCGMAACLALHDSGLSLNDSGLFLNDSGLCLNDSSSFLQKKAQEARESIFYVTRNGFPAPDERHKLRFSAQL